MTQRISSLRSGSEAIYFTMRFFVLIDCSLETSCFILVALSKATQDGKISGDENAPHIAVIASRFIGVAIYEVLFVIDYFPSDVAV